MSQCGGCGRGRRGTGGSIEVPVKPEARAAAERPGSRRRSGPDRGGEAARIEAAERPGSGGVRPASSDQAWAKRTRRPERRSTRTNQTADRNEPATTPPIVTAVVSSRKTLTVSVYISTARPTVVTKKMPAHSHVAPWKKRCSPGW